MNRFTASLIHLLGSACVVFLVYLFVHLIWYPGRLFEAASGTTLMTILVIVDVTLGPLITLIIYSPKKPSLKKDLITIAVLQVGFLLFGVWSIYSARPAYIPFAEDRFYLITANDIDPEDLRKSKDSLFQSLPQFGPEIVGTVLPEEREEREKILSGGLLGVGVQHLPQYYVPYRQAAESIKAAALPPKELMATIVNPPPADQERLTDYEVKKQAEGKSVRFVRLVTKTINLYVAVDAATGAVVQIL